MKASVGKRCLLTVACGKAKYLEMAEALALSLKLHGTTTPLVLVTDVDYDNRDGLFGAVVKPFPGVDPYLQKLIGFEVTDAEEVLFLDSDSLALKNLDPLMDRLQEFPFAIMGDWITDGYYWGETTSNLKKLGVEKIARVNGGFMYYRRSAEACALIERVMEIGRDFDKLGLDRLAGKIHDEGCVSPALSTMGHGELIPDHFGYSLTPWTCREVHLDVLRGEFRALHSYRGQTWAVSPMIYHSATSGWDWRYWREIRRLQRAFRKGEAVKLRSGYPMTLAQKVRRKLGEAWIKVYRATTRGRE